MAAKLNIDLKNNFKGGLDLDTALLLLPKNRYIDALNITRDAVEGNQDENITNVVSNVLVDNIYLNSFYTNPNFNLFLVVYNNGNGTLTARATFDIITVVATFLQYYNGSTWIDIVSGGGGGTLQGTLPEGDWQYRFYAIYSTMPPPDDVAYPFTEIDTVYECIGAYANTLRNTIVYMLYHSLNYDLILEYNNTTRVITPIFRNLIDSNFVDVTGFTLNGKIININIYNRDEGDLLYFLDSLRRPTGLNITRFKAGEYTPVTRAILDVAKAPPLVKPLSIYGNDTSRHTNSTTNRFFLFMFRFIYDDNEISTPSPIGSLPIPFKLLDNTYTNVITNNNVINISLTSGAKNVKSVELLMSYVNKDNTFSAWVSVTTINKSTNSIADDTVFNYPFYNDSTYAPIDPVEASQIQDYVPRYAYSQELLNGNVLGYAGITDGLSRTLIPNVVNTINTYAAGTGSDGTLYYNAFYAGSPSPIVDTRNIYTFNGSAAIGTVIKISLYVGITETIISTYTTLLGDTVEQIALGLYNSLVSTAPTGVTNISVLGNQLMFDVLLFSPWTSKSSVIVITSPTVGADTNSIPTFKFSTSKKIAFAYFDQNGRTNGILYHATVTFPAYAENGSQQVLLPYINTKIYHVPPIWAVSYQVFFTREPLGYLYWETPNVLTAESTHIYFDVTNIPLNILKNPTTGAVLNYSFKDGDRMRLIRRMSDDTVYGDTYDAAILGLVVNPLLNGVTPTTGSFIKVDNIAPLSTVDYTSKNFVIEIYRPAQQQASDLEETYYSIGQFPILNPFTSTRIHAGTITNQSTDYSVPAEINFYEGDSYFRLRQIPLTETGVGQFYVQDRNIVDFYTSAVSSLDGTPSVIDENAKEEFYPALIRHSQAFQPNTNINGLNRFQFENFLEVDYSYGIIMRMKVRQRDLHLFQQFKTGNVPLFRKIQKDPTGGNNIEIVTDKLLNPVDYYAGDWGIGTAAESLVSNNFADYFADNNKGAFLRLAQNGITPISIIANINNWATNEITLRKGDYKIYGAFNQKANSVIWSLEAVEEDLYLISETNNNLITESGNLIIAE